MFNLLKAEIYKLKTSKIFYFVILVTVAQAIAIPIYFHMNSHHLRMATGKEMFKFIVSSQNCLSLIMLMGVLVADCVASEFTSGYIKNLLSYGHSRSCIFISKCVICSLEITIVSLINPIICTIINTVLNGYGEVFTFSSLTFLLRVILFMIFVCIALGSFATLIGFIIRNYSLIIVAYVVFIDNINRVSVALSVKKNLLMAFYDKTIFAQSYMAVTENITFLQGTNIIIVSLVTTLISIVLGIYVFKKINI